MRIALPSRELEVFFLDEGQPDGEPVVLLHGILNTGASTFGGEIAALGERYRLIVPDARGHGRTLGPPEPFSFRELAHDTIALVEALGITRAHFVGFSLGAMQLLMVVRERPDLVRSLVLMGGAYRIEESARRQIAQIRANPSPVLLQRLAEWHEPGQGAGAGRRLLDQWWRLATSDELALTPADLREIGAPTLLIFGDRDPFYPAELPIRMREAIPLAELCVAPNAGHAVNVARPALVQLVLREFLARHPLAGG
ncbi:MAG: hydrolase [Dehalococcoidia bacterium]|nr:MAG: hydrolase [Dehalococcoidia bacterium]